MMAVKRREEEACLQQIQQIYGFNQHTRILLVKGFGVAAMYGAATVCVRMGAVSIYETRFDTARAIVEHRANHARLYQFEMLPLLDRFVTDLNKPTEFTAIMGAAPLGDALRARVLSLLASALIYSYSANEVWVISDVDSTGVGTVYPGVQVAVVDESDAPVPAGKSGRVRVRSPAMVEGYLDNPEATARSFRDGWFYTGDAGIMVGPRRLKIVGRVDELLNVGGLKVSPEDIGNTVAQVPGVIDVGVTSVVNADGVEEIGIAVVLGEGADFANIRTRITRRLKMSYGNAQVIAAARIPRTADTGKIQRAELKKLFVRA